MALILVFGIFSLLAVASLEFASIAQLQHNRTATTAADHSGSEGAGMYSAVDVSRPDAPACANGGSGDLTMRNSSGAVGTKLTYSYAAGGQCSSGSSNGPGEQCALCILNSGQNFPPNREITVQGQVAINGTAMLNSPDDAVCANAVSDPDPNCDKTGNTSTGTIYVYGGGCSPWSTCAYSGSFYDTTGPKPIQLSAPISDPLAGIYPKPNLSIGTSSGGIAQPGTWSTLTGTIAPGVYVVTSDLAAPVSVQTVFTSSTHTVYAASTVTDTSASWSTNAWAGHFIKQGSNLARIVSNTSTTISLTPAGWYSGGAPVSPPAAGSTFTIPGLAAIYLASGANVDLSNNDIVLAGPTTGAYEGAGIVADPGNTGVITFQGQSTLWMNGSLEVPAMSVNTTGGGNGGDGIELWGGRAVVGYFAKINVSSNVSGVVVFGSALTQQGCNVYSDTLSWSPLGPNMRGQGHSVVQTACSGGSGIISFGYTP